MTRLSREAVAARLGVGVATVGQMTSKTRRAQTEGHDITRPYLWLPLPGADDRWDSQDVEDYIADAPARRERKRVRTRGPAAKVIDIAGTPHMVLQVEHRITRTDLWSALRTWRVTHREIPMPTNRAGLLAATRWGLAEWGTKHLSTFSPTREDDAEVTAAVNILWPEEA